MEHNETLGVTVLIKFKNELEHSPASIRHHSNYKGGLIAHLDITLKFAKRYFPENNKLHFLALIHDIGKAREYAWIDDKIIRLKPEVDHIIHTIEMLHEMGIILNPEELNAIQMHHGGWSSFQRSNLCKLAVKLHFCDMMAVDYENNGG